jgi:putative ABC transport system ATP-binding protein
MVQNVLETSLLKILIGYLRPNSGKVLIDNEFLSRKNIDKLRKKIAYVPQNIDLGEYTAHSFLDEIKTFKSNTLLSIDMFPSLCDLFLISNDLLDKPANELSGGEKQRMQIIFSLLLNKKIHLLDEPTSQLDPKLKNKVVDYYISKSDWTVIVVSHDSNWLEAKQMRKIDLETL